MKSKLFITLALVGGIVIGVGGATIGHHVGASHGACQAPVANAQSYQVMIMDGKVDNADIHAKLCDSITFMNMDHASREIAFGPHEAHVPYDGVAEKVLNEGQSFTITLDQAGKFHWHDHLHDEVEGYFTVSK